jgi:NTE family protein
MIAPLPSFMRASAIVSLLAALAVLAGCATHSRPINARIDHSDPRSGYRYETRPEGTNDPSTMVILAFSGGGTRAAAFSFGVLEELRRTDVTIGGKKTRLLDEVDGITGVSGGSFTALSYGLYGERLFGEYEQRFLKRDIQGELLARLLSPRNWNALWSEGWGRSEMAAELYDEVLFGGATFADLEKKPGPMIMATATDISTGSRLGFTQGEFDLICSDLSTVPLSRAAAASSAVPLVLSPVTLNNYGGTCTYREPGWARAVADPNGRARPAGRALQRLREMRSFQDSQNRPYLHLVDGGLADNLGMRVILETMETIEANRAYGRSSRSDQIKRIVVVVVNSLSIPKTDWDERARPPSDLVILLKATGVPIDRYSYEAVELLKDIIARWQTIRTLKESGAFANAGNPALGRAVDVPDIDLYAIDVSFASHPSQAERDYLNEMPTSFRLTDEQVDRLRAAAGAILRASPEYQRLIEDLASAPRKAPSLLPSLLPTADAK